LSPHSRTPVEVSSIRVSAPKAISTEKERQLAEIARRRQYYVGERPPVSAKGRVAIVIDGGIAGAPRSRDET
jgi:putative phosphoribosyl transferase